eukprot:TRINITY_DN236_c0_g1_i1.p1 TRINITY_DN236_c0_g1~~TRINITY_DN236_c0_g1_i1.p1  ORF type:complete len:577 (-),score=82.24 TRINITY_DN236_c0_g1_i1:1819-3549(-)
MTDRRTPLSTMSSTESEGLIVVLDTAALIAGTDSLFSLGGLVNAQTGGSLYSPSSDAKVTFFSVPEVFHEVRDPRARARLTLLEGSIILRAPSSEAMAETVVFAKSTGDFSVLSLTDLKVMALTRMLERETNGDKFLKTAPAQRHVSDVRIGTVTPFEVLDQLEAMQALPRVSKDIERNCSNRGEEYSEGEWQIVSKSRTKPKGQEPKVKKTDIRNKNKTLDQENKNARNLQGTSESEKGRMDTAKEMAPKAEIENEEVEGEVEETKEIIGRTVTEDEHPALVNKKNDRQDSKSNGRRPRYRRRRRKGVAVEKIPGISENVLSVESRANESPHAVEDESRKIKSSVNHAPEMDTEDKCVQNSSSDDTQDSDEDGSEWINESNLEEHLARDRGEEVDQDEERRRVACVTTDFAMQNTMLQMGLKLLSVDGRRSIRKVKHFALRCQACGIVTTELERKFCDKCGNSCMHRVAYRIDKNGKAYAYLNPKKKASLRGTKYPIPMPRGGRHNNDLILREDQIDPVKQRRLQKQRERLNVDVLDPSNFYNAGAKFNPYNKPLIVGYGRRNPNEVRGNARGKR